MKFSIQIECEDCEKLTMASVLHALADHMVTDAFQVPEVGSVQRSRVHFVEDALGWEPRIKAALEKLKKATAKELCRELGGEYDPGITRIISRKLSGMRVMNAVRVAGKASAGVYYWELVE